MSNIINEIKLSGVTYQIEDSTALHNLDSTVTSGGTNAVKGSGIYNAITAATGALAETISEELSGKVNTDTYTAYTASTAAELSGKASTGDIVNFFDGAAYEMSGDTHVINFYHGNTVKATINAEDFIADGFLSAVTIENRTISGESVPCLVFDWNTTAGIEETVIPLSSTFEPDNYYNKAAIDAIVSGINEDISAVSGDVSTINTNYVSGVSVNGTATTVSNHVAAINVKTINGTSIVGSGDITVQSLPTVSGTTLIFS